MRIRRLGWAGIELESHGDSLVIDLIGRLPTGAAGGPVQFAGPSQPGKACAALVTHLHADHTDVSAIVPALASGAPVLRPEPFDGPPEDGVWTVGAERELAASDVAVVTTTEWQSEQIGPFAVTAVPAVDGLGDPQVSWVVEAEGLRVFHGGDTVFHGFWWQIARRFGPVDIAALPINGAMVDFPHMQPPSRLPAVLTPQQAAQVGVLLGARKMLPIHFGMHVPPYYVEVEDAFAGFRGEADAFGLAVLSPAVGAWSDVAASS